MEQESLGDKLHFQSDTTYEPVTNSCHFKVNNLITYMNAINIYDDPSEQKQ